MKCKDDKRFRCIPDRFACCKECSEYLDAMKQSQFFRKEFEKK